MKLNRKKILFYSLFILLILFFKLSTINFEIMTTSPNKVNPNKEFVFNPINDQFKKTLNQKSKNNDINDVAFFKKEQKIVSKEEKVTEEKVEELNREIERREDEMERREEEMEALERDGPDKAFEQDFYRTMNLEIKRPTPELLPEIINENYLKVSSNVKAFAIPGATSSAPWVELGPNNVGGRTRAISWDPNDPTRKKVWAGGVSGGLWYNNDITSTTSSWNKVDDFWQTLSINKIVFDTLDKKIAYVTTGEAYTSSTSSGIGAGIWKTTNGGTSWSQLSSTSNYLYANDIIIRNENDKSVVYAAIDANNYMGRWTSTANVGLYRSTDNGATWSQTLPIIDSANTNKVPFVAASIQISKNNTIWIGTKASPNSNNNRGGGYILKSVNGTDWTVMKRFNVNNGRGRITIAVAPSNEKIIYAYVENDGKLENLYRSEDEGLTWNTLTKPIDADNGIPASDFTRGQAWYNQSMAVDPNDPNTAIVGGIDLFKTMDGGKTWQQISKWSNNPGLNVLKCSLVHADQHAVVYKPGSSNTVLFGNDGGIFYAGNIFGTDTIRGIIERNNGYNVTQFYAGAIHPSIGKNFFLAGAQDNGTQKFLSPTFSSTSSVFGGDGAFCFIDQSNPKYQIASYVGNSYYLSTDSGVSFNKTLISNSDLGSFINPATYDNVLHILYSNSSSDYLVRIKNITGTPKLENVTVPNLTTAVTALKVSPYNHLSSTLYLGTNTGKLLKVTNADSIPSSTLIGGASFPSGSISCIEIGASENELLVTFFNYGSKKIWYTSDGGKNWVDKMGNFPDMPVRWALFNPNKISSEVILATELGVYATNNFNNASPTWTQANNGFANVRTDMMQIRSADYAVIAATHGRGLFYNSSFSEAKAPVISSFTPKIGVNGTKITIKGTNFLNASEVRFGGLPALSFKVESDTLITAVVGIAYPGFVNVKTTGGIAALSGFSSNPPKLSSFLPKSGGNGIPITISGSNLTEITKLVIGGRTVKDFTIESSTTISTCIPDSTINGNVIISNEFYADSLTGFTTCSTPTLSKVNDTAFCDGNSLQISSSTASQYQWINNNTNLANAISQTFKIVATGNYQVKTTNNNCSALSYPIKVTVNSLPASPIAKDTFYCNNLKVDTLKANFSVGHSLLWYGTDTTAAANNYGPVPNTASVGNLFYYVSQVNNTTKCESKKVKINIIINPIPASPIVRDSTYCQNNANAKLSVSNISGHALLWYGTNATGGNASTTSLLAATSDTITKSYYVSQFNTTTGCESSRAKINATITPAPVIPTIKDTAYCNNSATDTLKAIAINGHILNWYDVATGGALLKSSPKPNSLVVGNQNYYVSQTSNLTNCESVRGKIMVTINTIPTTPTVRDTFYCQNASISDSFKVVYSSGHNLLWYGNDSVGGVANTITPKPNTANIGFQKFYVSQKNITTGCEGNRSKLNVEIRPTPTTPTITRDTSNNLVSNVALKSIWYKDGTALNDSTQKFKPTLAGSYTVKSSALGCNSASSAPYYYLVTDIIKLSPDEFIKLAPNPFYNQINFDFIIKGYQKLNIEIYDLATGARVDFRINVTAGTPLQLSQLAKGTYIFRVSSSDNKILQQFKIVKM